MLYNIEAEKSVLSYFIMSDKYFYQYGHEISTESFYKVQNGLVFKAIKSIYKKKQKPDTILIDNELKTERAYIDAGGVDWLESMLDSFIPSSSDILGYIEIIKEKARARKLEQIATNIKTEIRQEQKTTSEILDQYEKELTTISEVTEEKKSIPAMYAAESAFEKLMKKAEIVRNGGEPYLGLKTGLKNLDDIVIGFNPNDLIVIGANSSVGKTALVCQILHNVTMVQKEMAVFYSMEMSHDKIMERLFCYDAQINLGQIKRGNFSEYADQALSASMVKISQSKLIVNDNVLTTDQIKADLRRMEMETGEKVKLIAIDYLERIALPRFMQSKSVFETVAYRISELKNIAKEFKLACIVLAQFTKEVQRTQSKRPSNVHLKNSSKIEEDADFIILLSRLGRHYPNVKELGGVSILDVTKSRDGELGECYQYFDGAFQMFRNVRDDEMAAYSEGVEKIKGLK